MKDGDGLGTECRWSEITKRHNRSEQKTKWCTDLINTLICSLDRLTASRLSVLMKIFLWSSSLFCGVFLFKKILSIDVACSFSSTNELSSAATILGRFHGGLKRTLLFVMEIISGRRCGIGGGGEIPDGPTIQLDDTCQGYPKGIVLTNKQRDQQKNKQLKGGRNSSETDSFIEKRQIWLKQKIRWKRREREKEGKSSSDQYHNNNRKCPVVFVRHPLETETNRTRSFLIWSKNSKQSSQYHRKVERRGEKKRWNGQCPSRCSFLQICSTGKGKDQKSLFWEVHCIDHIGIVFNQCSVHFHLRF